MHTRLVQYKFNSNIQIYHSLLAISANVLYLCIECLCLYIVGHITHQAVQTNWISCVYKQLFIFMRNTACRMLLCTKYGKNTANKSWYLTLMFSKTHVSSIFFCILDLKKFRYKLSFQCVYQFSWIEWKSQFCTLSRHRFYLFTLT